MFFNFMWFWFTNAMSGWFRKLYVVHDAPVPKNVPVIYASTHPNSVIDYLPAPYSQNHVVKVLVRGDVFENKYLDKFFRFLWMLPVYRFRDGYSSLNKNDQSFRACYKAFDQNEHVLIFSEGICIQEKTLQPLKKGTARLALDYLFKHGGKEIYVVPTTSNYTHYRTFRASMTTFYGTPIKASDYKELYEQNANKAYEKLTADITKTLRENFIEEKDYQDNSLTEKALEALRLGKLESRKPWIIDDRSFFDLDKALVEVLNEKGEEVLSDEFKNLANKLGLSHKHEGLLTAKYGSDVFLMQAIILTPIFIILGVLHAIPHYAVRWILNNKIKNEIFHDTITVFGNGAFYLFQTIIVLIVSLSTLGLAGLWIPISMMLLSLIGLSLLDDYVFSLYNWKNIKHKAEFQKLYDEVANLASIDKAD
jgi:1-acyl-sn-glycerol-3-phosphate acyltransferase